MHLTAGRVFLTSCQFAPSCAVPRTTHCTALKLYLIYISPASSLSPPLHFPPFLSLSHRRRIREVVLNRRLFLTLQAWLIDLHPCHSTVSPSYLRIMMCYLPKPRSRPRQIYSETQYQINNRQLHFL